MKFFLLSAITFLLLLSLSSCGKKAEVNDPKSDENMAPSTAEIYFHAFTEIKRAVENNDLPSLKRVVAENPGIDLNQTLVDGETFLIMAIKKDFREIRNFLLEKNCNIEKSNINKETPLIAAVEKNRVNTVKILLDLDVDLEKKNGNGDTALHVAIKKHNDEISLLLLKQGANIDATDKNDRNAYKLAQDYELPLTFEFLRSLMQVESGAPDLASFRHLLTQGDVKRLTNILNQYPKIVADYESINPLAILVDAKDTNSALSNAQLLLRYEANVNGPKDAEQTPLIKATLTKKQDFANLYLSFKANPQLLDKDGKSALIHAVELNDLRLVNLLLSYSAVEKYTFRKDGKKITYDACRIAVKISEKLSSNSEREQNSQIRQSLACGFFSWFF